MEFGADLMSHHLVGRYYGLLELGGLEVEGQHWPRPGQDLSSTARTPLSFKHLIPSPFNCFILSLKPMKATVTSSKVMVVMETVLIAIGLHLWLAMSMSRIYQKP